MMASLLLWLMAAALGLIAIAVTGMEEEDAARHGRRAHGGYFATSLVMMAFALLAAHTA